MTYHIIFKRIYTYTMANRTISNPIRCIQCQIRRIPMHIRFMLLSRPKPLIKSLVPITFQDLGCPFKTFRFVILNFHFQKCRDPNPRLDPVGGSKLESGLLRRFQSKHSFHFIKFLFSKVSRPESPTRPERRIRTGARFTPTFSIIFPKHVVYVILFWTFLIEGKHFFSGNPMTIYKFRTPITFTLNTCIYK